ncbi:hypothetical protein QSI00_24915, partial [Escherichia coli]|uniref:hypothetical protein n=1 Tax=Escherichia coli TaxID=562 RepID=UPI00256EBECB
SVAHGPALQEPLSVASCWAVLPASLANGTRYSQLWSRFSVCRIHSIFYTLERIGIRRFG